MQQQTQTLAMIDQVLQIFSGTQTQHQPTTSDSADFMKVTIAQHALDKLYQHREQHSSKDNDFPIFYGKPTDDFMA
eukprot:1134671-Ditylum_brightwellii.AAC.1